MYETFEHTADMGIHVRAGSLNEVFADAARGLFSIIVENLDTVAPTEAVSINLRADNLEELLHDWLAELLYVFSTRRLVLADFAVEVTSLELAATARGEPVDLHKHELDAEVKAVTWHHLKLVQQDDQWLAEVIVDV